MRVHLLDVNVLLALAWPNHALHSRAHAWLQENRERPWATCPLTQAALIRLSCNPNVVGEAVFVSEALALVRELIASPGHEHWPQDLPVAEALAPFGRRLTGHKQITDAYLLGLAIHRNGRLTTFDRRIAALLPERSPHRDALLVLPI